MPALAVLAPFLTAAAFVFCNEMGDKSQLLVVALAARLSWWRVLLGVAIAVLLGNGLAVAAGALLARTPGVGAWVQMVSSVLFIVFGLCSLAAPDRGAKKRRARENTSSIKSDSYQGKPYAYNNCDRTSPRHGAGSYHAQRHTSGTKPAQPESGIKKSVASVAVTFFFAEMGDKTQLAAMTLAARFAYAPFWVLAGTVAGMLAADSIAVVAGTLLHSRLPAGVLRPVAAALFILFGLAGVYDGLVHLLFFRPAGALLVVALIGALAAAVGRLVRRPAVPRRAGRA